MTTLNALIRRNTKLFFKDKGTFFTALITPIILLVLYATFLYNVYEDSFLQGIPQELVFDSKVIKGLVGGLLLSSLLAVSAVTVPFCAHLCSVQDKVTGARGDFDTSPANQKTIALAYYFSTVLNGLIISLVATALGMVYLAFTGWYLSFGDCLLFVGDTVLLVLFGSAFSALVSYPLTTQGQLSAVGSIVSSGYGFICGAYMPISQFGSGIGTVVSFLPGTYGTALLRNHALKGAYREMERQGFPAEVIQGMRDTADCNVYFFGNKVQIWQCYLVLIGAIVLLTLAYLLINARSDKKRRAEKVKNR